ncbi:PcfJ domain-containing protein [Bradyrhizobium liaoningense]|uniref:PcfJ domain-containing protein n=1 Tax=Bradyrhizobium liaoningense TaxID=43992 RepID=UPI0004B20867|nr:PcfJ domain-containing protein [Bradyrhizobium liaoningense]
MTINVLPAPYQVAGRSELLERRLRRYHSRVQGAVRALAVRHPRLADLAASFPALLFTLAVPRARLDPARAIAGVIDGVALAQAAVFADLPLWLRKPPPEAFVRPIPRLPDGELFRRQIANHLPRSPKMAPTWLQLVSEAAELAHEPMAAWIAREYVRAPRRVNPARLRHLCLWVWFSSEPATSGHRLIERPWSPDMRIDAARSAAHDWRTIATLHVNLGRLPIADMWLRAGHVAGYEFVPLDSMAAIAEEAKAMRNCLNSYGPNLVHNHSRMEHAKGWRTGRNAANRSSLSRSAAEHRRAQGSRQRRCLARAVVGGASMAAHACPSGDRHGTMRVGSDTARPRKLGIAVAAILARQAPDPGLAADGPIARRARSAVS